MAAAVAVKFFVAGLVDYVTRKRVGLGAAESGFDFFQAVFLGLEDEGVDFLLFFCRFGGEDDPGHVAAVPLVFHAHVNEDEVAFA